MDTYNKIIIIIILVGIVLYFGQKKSNFASSSSTIINTDSIDHNIKIWSSAMCKEYIDICQDRINKGLVPDTAMNDCLQMNKFHQCYVD